MKWPTFFLLCFLAPCIWAQAVTSGVNKADIFSPNDLATWAAQPSIGQPEWEDFYQFPHSGGSYTIVYEAGNGDYDFYVEAVIGPEPDSPELDFERIRAFNLEQHLSGYDLSDLQEFSGIGTESAGYQFSDEGEVEGFYIIAKSRNVVVSISASPYQITRPELARQRILVVLDNLSRLNHEPDLGLLRLLTAANIAMPSLYRLVNYANRLGIEFDESTFSEFLLDGYEPGVYTLNYNGSRADGLQLFWSMYVFAADAGIETETYMQHVAVGIVTDLGAEQIRDRQFENWNDGSLAFRHTDPAGLKHSIIITSFDDRVLKVMMPETGSLSEAINLIDPYLDDLLAIDPVPAPEGAFILMEKSDDVSNTDDDPTPVKASPVSAPATPQSRSNAPFTIDDFAKMTGQNYADKEIDESFTFDFQTDGGGYSYTATNMTIISRAIQWAMKPLGTLSATEVTANLDVICDAPDRPDTCDYMRFDRMKRVPELDDFNGGTLALGGNYLSEVNFFVTTHGDYYVYFETDDELGSPQEIREKFAPVLAKLFAEKPRPVPKQIFEFVMSYRTSALKLAVSEAFATQGRLPADREEVMLFLSMQNPDGPNDEYSDFRVPAPGVLVVEFNHPEMTGTIHLMPVIEGSYITSFTCRVEGFPREWVPEGCDS